ncbi:MAG: type 4a pilus biogenesis protein PilO [Deltaproteobacteria bacterium]|nr:type 4a pilus biogenesis protein PilO [Deltaproteobacteria bacterium]
MEKFLNQFTKLSFGKKAIALFVVIAALVGFDYFVFMSSQWDSKETLQVKAEELQIKLLDKQQKAKDLTEFKREVERLKQRLREAEEQLPKKAEIPKLLKDIAYEGQQSGLLVSKFELKVEEKRGTFAAVPVAMVVEGSFHEVAVFFDRLAKLPRIVNVTDINLKDPKIVNKKIMLKGAYTATTYRFLESGESAPKKTAAAPRARDED